MASATEFASVSITDKPKKRGRPATGRDPMLGFRAGDAFRRAVDEAAAREGVGRSELIRRAVVAYLRERGLTAE